MDIKEFNPYDILGVSHSDPVDIVKKRYRDLAKQYHPDLHPGDEFAAARFKEISIAYGILSDTEKRRRYDETVQQGYSKSKFDFGDFDFEDMFNTVSNEEVIIKKDKTPVNGEAVSISVGISLESSLHGCETVVTFKRRELCEDCKGEGVIFPDISERIKCEECNATGYKSVRYDGMKVKSAKMCPRCGGFGVKNVTPCKSCDGKGTKIVQRKLSVKIPAGIADGQVLTVPGQGNCGLNGGMAGIVAILIKVKEHPLVKRKGADLYVNIPLEFTTAVFGGEVKAMVFDKESIFQIPAGTDSGQIFTVKGRGAPILRGKGNGDLFVKVTIVTPKNLTVKQKEALHKYRELLV